MKSVRVLGHPGNRHVSLREVLEGAAPLAHGNQQSCAEAQPEWIAQWVITSNDIFGLCLYPRTMFKA